MSKLMSELMRAEREKDRIEELLRVIRKQKDVARKRGINISRIESLESGNVQKLEKAKNWIVKVKAEMYDEIN